MKPPSRPRIRPSRFVDKKGAEPLNRFAPRPNGMEMRSLLLALKQQKSLNTELDYLALRKHVPKWSLHQIQDVIKSLRRCVVHRVYLQLQKQTREEQKNKVPVEQWAELAGKMAGVHEETISAVFSQILAIAASEPCSLHHSDSPTTTNSLSPQARGFCTIPQRPKSQPGPSPPVIILPGQTCKPPQSHGKTAASNLSAQTTTVTPPSVTAKEEPSELLQKTVSDKDSAMPSTSTSHKSLLSQPVSKPAPTVSALSAVFTAAPLLTSATDQPEKQTESGQSAHAWQYRSMGMKNVVDFEKMYQFMSNLVLKKHTQPLTAMESAVLLDLLMSLPEELPLLDCKELQHHLLQVHARLKGPAVGPSTDEGAAVANSASTSVREPHTIRANQLSKGPDVSFQTQSVQFTEEDTVQRADGDFLSQSPAVNLSKDKVDWAAAGVCPLNPFMVPVALLKRQ